MTYSTGNAVPSRDPRDLLDNAESFDIRVTSRTERSTPDRLGVMRKTWHGIEQDFAEFLVASGFEPVHLTYQAGVGLQVDRPTQLIDYSGSVYRVKMPASFPVSLSGAWATDSVKLVDVGDQSLREHLASSGGAEMVGLGAGTVASAIGGLAEEINTQTRARFATEPASATLRTPKYTVLSPAADGDGIQAFPSAGRYNGVDYVFFRSGLGHTGSDGKVKVTLVSQHTGQPLGEYTLLNPAYDVRDPCVATDARGNAVLIGGKMKIVIFHASGASGVYVYDYDPSTPSHGLLNRVSVNGPFVACKSDVVRLADGSFRFVCYSTEQLCYMVSTTDFTSFTWELVGNGNECAVAEEADGTLVVIARDSHPSGDRMTVYKKPVGGEWRSAFHIPYALHSPSLRKLSKVRATNPGYIAGWLLLGRDLRGVSTQGVGDLGNIRLTALISRDNSGLSIDSFEMAQDIMGQPRVASTEIAYGDAFYSSAVTAENGSEVTIYTYGPVGRSDQQVGTTYGHKILRVAAVFKGGQGLLVPDHIKLSPNALANGNFDSGRHWKIPEGASVSGGVLQLETTNAGHVEQKIRLEQGRQYAIHARVRRVMGDGNAQNVGVTVAVRDASLSLSSVAQVGALADVGSDFHILSGQPFRVASTGEYTVRVSAGTVDGSTVSEIDWLYVGEANDLVEFVDCESGRVFVSGTASMAGTASGTMGTFSISQFVWQSSFGMLMSGNRPAPFETPEEVQKTLRVISATDASGRPLMVRTFTINSLFALQLSAELFPSNASAAPIVSPVSVQFEAAFER